jgi:hypothetical protein
VAFDDAIFPSICAFIEQIGGLNVMSQIKFQVTSGFGLFQFTLVADVVVLCMLLETELIRSMRFALAVVLGAELA